MRTDSERHEERTTDDRTHRGRARRDRTVILPVAAAVALAVVLYAPQSAVGFVYTFVSEERGANIITHSGGYAGTGGEVTVTVGIDPENPLAENMIVSVRNAVAVWNLLEAEYGNVGDLHNNQHDFESAILHELGHAIGLRHCTDDTGDDFAFALVGPNGVLNRSAGADGHTGTQDDVRGDDVNANWFWIGVNHPFQMAQTVDSTTYSRDLADLPSGDLFAAVGTPGSAEVFNVPHTQALMRATIGAGQHRRALTDDDVAGIRFAMSGLDEVAGTADDYTVRLDYIGLRVDADILVTSGDLDGDSPAGGGLVVTNTNGGPITEDGENIHARINGATITFDRTGNWFFNQQLLPANSPWMNGRNPLDVDNSGEVVPLDVLHIVNTLNDPQGGSRELEGSPGPGDYFYDTNNDRNVSPIDVLLVINYLNRPTGEGEGGPLSADTTSGRARLARDLDQQLALWAPWYVVNSVNYYADQSWNPEHHKYFRGQGGWYYLTQDGRLFRYYGGSGDELLAYLDSDYYRTPALLHDAQEDAYHGSIGG